MKGDRVVLDPAVGTITGQTQPNGGPASWSGSFSLPARQSLTAGTSPLQLDDGRSGDIQLGSVAAGFNEPALVLFTGSGALAET